MQVKWPALVKYIRKLLCMLQMMRFVTLCTRHCESAAQTSTTTTTGCGCRWPIPAHPRPGRTLRHISSSDARLQITACKHQFDMEILQVVCFLHVYSSVADFDTPQCMSLQSRCDELTVELERCQVSRQSFMPFRLLSACRCP
jgi:hypothetical protein